MIAGNIHLSLHFLQHILSAFLIGLCIFKILKILMQTKRPVNAPPGSSGFPLIGETLSFLAANNSNKGFYEFVQARRAKYGNCFKTNIFGETHVFVSSTEAAKLVLSSEVGYYNKTFIRSITELLGEQSVLCASDNHHRFLRHQIGNLLTSDNMASFIKLFDKLTTETQSNWKNRRSIVVLDEALQISFRAMCQMLMSIDNEDELQKLQTDIFLVCDAMLSIPLKLPWTTFFRGLKARQRIMKTLRKMIKRRRESLENHKDFLQALLLENKSTSGGPMTDSQIQDNIVTLIIAGQITTASAIAWMVKYLDENPDVQEVLRDQQSHLAAKTSGSELGMQAINEMAYALKVVKETLRMSTIVTWFPMIALKDCQLEGYLIKKGWVVNVDARYIHNDETVYEDPKKFFPSRFNEDPKPYGFLAFGTGGTTCLGMNLAKAMMLVFVHRLVTSYRWKVIDPDTSLEKGAMFPRLRSGCPISVTPIEHTDPLQS